jgi:hypothetical protein
MACEGIEVGPTALAEVLQGIDKPRHDVGRQGQGEDVGTRRRSQKA